MDDLVPLLYSTPYASCLLQTNDIPPLGVRFIVADRDALLNTELCMSAFRSCLEALQKAVQDEP